MIKKSLLMMLLALVSACCMAQNTSAVNMLLTPEIGGIQQAIDIRTDDKRKPVLLFLSGGPGSSMMNNAASFTNILKSRFTLVQWDQRDAGKTLALNASSQQPTVAQMVEDTRQVIEFVRKELRQDKIYLLGSRCGTTSWGSICAQPYPQCGVRSISSSAKTTSRPPPPSPRHTLKSSTLHGRHYFCSTIPGIKYIKTSRKNFKIQLSA